MSCIFALGGKIHLDLKFFFVSFPMGYWETEPMSLEASSPPGLPAPPHRTSYPGYFHCVPTPGWDQKAAHLFNYFFSQSKDFFLRTRVSKLDK